MYPNYANFTAMNVFVKRSNVRVNMNAKVIVNFAQNILLGKVEYPNGYSFEMVMFIISIQIQRNHKYNSTILEIQAG